MLDERGDVPRAVLPPHGCVQVDTVVPLKVGPQRVLVIERGREQT